MNKYIEEDYLNLSKKFIFINDIRGTNILITGATGMIGSLILGFLVYLNENLNLNIKIFGLSRNKTKTEKLYFYDKVTWLYQGIEEKIEDCYKFDYIIHTACPTNSQFLKNKPVEVINQSVTGAINIFEYAKKNNVKSIVFLSSIEIYGQIFDYKEVQESEYGYLNHLCSRSSYPESKKIIESLAVAYVNEYNTPIKIARLTQTLGAGVPPTDNRVFSQFARSIINNEDIILHTEGKSSKCYIYTIDAINALFYILFKGNDGDAYNVANEDTYISIYELAKFLKNNFNNKIAIHIELQKNNNYAPDTLINLSTKKLEALGWKPMYSLYDMFDRLISYIRSMDNGYLKK